MLLAKEIADSIFKDIKEGSTSQEIAILFIIPTMDFYYSEDENTKKVYREIFQQLRLVEVLTEFPIMQLFFAGDDEKVTEEIDLDLKAIDFKDVRFFYSIAALTAKQDEEKNKLSSNLKFKLDTVAGGILIQPEFRKEFAIELSTNEWAVFQLLLENQGRLVSNLDICRKLEEVTGIETNNVNKRANFVLFQLRRKLYSADVAEKLGLKEQFVAFEPPSNDNLKIRRARLNQRSLLENELGFAIQSSHDFYTESSEGGYRLKII